MATQNGMKNGKEVADFESSFARLQEVVRTLSEGNLTLQESLSAFEEGMSLADYCGGLLEQAELRVQQVSERAMRAGSTALGEQLARGAADFQETEIVAFGITQVERTLVLEDEDDVFAPPRQEAPPRRAQAPESRRAQPESMFADLDPLFDESD